MCGILGSFNNKYVQKEIAKAINTLQPRGQDAVGITDGETIHTATSLKDLKILKGNSIAHTLHAIVGHIAQPLKEEGIIVANCEIYNWKELEKKYDLQAKNDAHLLLKLLDKLHLEALKELDGVYAFAYWKNNKLILARDLIGVKPLWYAHQDGFFFASEKKAIPRDDVRELSPRSIIEYDIQTNHLNIIKRPFYTKSKTKTTTPEKVATLLKQAVLKRIPDIKVGVLFSGGIDSTIIAKICHDNNIDATCYTAVVDNPNIKEPHDLTAAKTVAKKYGFNHKVIKIKDIPKLAKKVVEEIEEAHAIKVAVGMTIYAAAQQAKKDKCRVLFSGIGSEELFAGYQRHKEAKDVNDECLAGLRWLYERDLYRDDVLTMRQGLELRLPFLDKQLIEHALTIPPAQKINNIEKYILRQAALTLGIDEEDAFRPKKAAQYGSKTDHALKKIANKQGKNRVQYLQQFTKNHNKKLGVLCSGGKDSWYAAYIMNKQNYQLSCLLTMKSENPHSYMFHTPAIDLVKMQAEAAELPIIEQITKGEKEKELEDLKKLLQKANIDGIVVGALFSQYQRERIETIADELDLKVYAPLWHMDQESELRGLLDNNFEIIMTAIAADGLHKNWLGKTLTHKDVDKLVELRDTIGFNCAGEGGEFESLVLNCPLFKKKLHIETAEKIMENTNTGKLEIKKLRLIS